MRDAKETVWLMLEIKTHLKTIWLNNYEKCTFDLFTYYFLAKKYTVFHNKMI